MRIASVQSDVYFGDAAQNAAHAIEKLRELKEQGVEFAVFPEAFLTGYVVDSEDEARRIALSTILDGDRLVQAPEPIERLVRACHELDMYAVAGFAGSDGRSLYNGALFASPTGDARVYRKAHLPELGFDRFATPGDGLHIFETRFGRIGILICFDLRMPEAARCLSLSGADLIVLPTNWPHGAEISADVLALARAAENRVFVATCNRVGEENGFRFIGRSKIIGVGGEVLAQTGANADAIIEDIDLAAARQKRVERAGGRYCTETFGARRPELYGRIVE